MEQRKKKKNEGTSNALERTNDSPFYGAVMIVHAAITKKAGKSKDSLTVLNAYNKT